jgi:2-C-methyl-D-erythritol 2,4-cyclodiphosphate synthase
MPREKGGSSTPPPTSSDALPTRVGIGYDSHRYSPRRPLTLGGVLITSEMGLEGHSDADAICHAITDAILGAAGLGDIGEMFPDSDPANKDCDSIGMLAAAVQRVAKAGYTVGQIDATLIAETPKLAPYRDQMRARLATALGIDPRSVSVKGKTNEGMGWIGRKEGLACIAVATLNGKR